MGVNDCQLARLDRSTAPARQNGAQLPGKGSVARDKRPRLGWSWSPLGRLRLVSTVFAIGRPTDRGCQPVWLDQSTTLLRRRGPYVLGAVPVARGARPCVRRDLDASWSAAFSISQRAFSPFSALRLVVES